MSEEDRDAELLDYLDACHSHSLCPEVTRLRGYLPTLETAERWGPLRAHIAANPGHGMFRDPDLLDIDGTREIVRAALRVR